MLEFVARRLLHTALVTLGVVTLVFVALRMSGDPAASMLPGDASVDELRDLRHALGLDQPLSHQYVSFLGSAVRGDFGESFRHQQPAFGLVLERLPATLELAFAALALAVVIALPLGILAAVRRGRVADLLVSLVSYLGVSLPEFVTATLAILFFADYLGWLPATGYVPVTEDPGRALLHLVLPVATVSLILVAHVSRMVRSELVDALHTDYVRAARLKGLPERIVLRRHALRNALLPTITIVALDVGYVLGGIIVVEEIFAIPGIGRTLIVAVQNRDLPTIQAGALVMAATYCVMNFAADLLYAVLDKRIQYA